ncbi:MAG TPA: sodium:calcium antiporter [Thermodesulfovibrionales bacterium]|jgi:cation:H+ antiporter|nr:sodium:calcium antiporter [Thermodesulfovibrionales bacterium]
MLRDTTFLLISLFVILAAAEGFTNGVEAFGRRFSLSQAVVGSILAAVGTALPETILPIVAIFLYGGASANDIGIGAILGAPFMLSTLAFFLVGLTALASFLKKRRTFEINVEAHSTTRDLTFFVPMYLIAVFVPSLGGRSFAIPVAVLLVAGYLFYAYQTFRGESGDIGHSEGLYLSRLMRRLRFTKDDTPHPAVTIAQVIGALSMMVAGAHTFVRSLEHVSLRFGMNPLLFALILAPVATELPEKFNSVTWTWKGRDTLAVGNITGAMVFQSTFPVCVGLLFTDWKLTGMALFSAILALASASIVLLQLLFKKRLSPVTLLLGGGLYLVYAVVLLLNSR